MEKRFLNFAKSAVAEPVGPDILEALVVKLRLRDNENVNDAVKRFRKLVEHAGIKKEMRRREFFEKPSDEARRNRRRAQLRARRAQTQPVIGR